jgi:hypothetical protein
MGAAMSAPTCPHCGAEQDARYPDLYYQCDTFKGMPEHQTLKCLKGQVAQQAAEIERLRGTLQYLIDVAEESNDNGTKTISTAFCLQLAVVALKTGLMGVKK